MINSGDLINFENIRKIGTSWRTDWSDSSNTSSWVYLYVYSPCFRIINKTVGGLLWGAQNGSTQVAYWNGDEWQTVWAKQLDEVRNKNTTSHTWDHNYNGGSEGDVHDRHLWRIMYYNYGDGSGTKSAYIGGLELVPQEIYETMRGELIRYTPCIYTTTDMHEEFHPSQFRGTPISILAGTYDKICASSD